MAIQGRSYANVPIVKRAQLEDEYYRGTTPLVQVRHAGVDDPRFRASVVDARAHLEDEFYRGTVPFVVAAPPTVGLFPVARFVRSPLEEIVVSEDQPGVRQLVVAAQTDPRWLAVPGTRVARAHLEDEFYRGTSPTVIAAPLDQRFTMFKQSQMGRGSIEDLAAPVRVLVIAAPLDLRWTYHPTTPLVARAHLEDEYRRGTAPVVVVAQPDGRLLLGRVLSLHGDMTIVFSAVAAAGASTGVIIIPSSSGSIIGATSTGSITTSEVT